MKIINKNAGVGLVEVLVATLIIIIGILDYTALRMRAVNASTEARTRAQAITVMRSLTVNMCANMQAQNKYPTAIRVYTNFNATTTAPDSCFNSACISTQLAIFEAFEAVRSDFPLDMHLTMADCPGIPETAIVKRQCLFAAWGETTFSLSGNSSIETANYADCMDDMGVYVVQSSCIMMEAY